MTNHTPSWEEEKDHSNISGMILSNVMKKINYARGIAYNQIVKLFIKCGQESKLVGCSWLKPSCYYSTRLTGMYGTY